MEVGGAGIGGRAHQGGGVRLPPGRLRRLLLGLLLDGGGLLVLGDDLEGGINGDGDSHGSAQIDRQRGRELGLSLVLDPLFGESVGNGQQDRAFDIAEGAGGSQHGRGDGPQLIGGDGAEGRSPGTCEGIRLHGNLRTDQTVSSITASWSCA